MQVEVVRSLCRQCGLPDKGTKLECVLRLQKTVCNINNYDYNNNNGVQLAS